MDEKIINRINELSSISKERQLTEEEKYEQSTLRKLFIEKFRNNFKSVLDNVKFVDKK
ncbi:DUF896 domain-containing protein [Spiroplasma endosymbiont of Aspidapion aeneum]|uniref:DUF896 domain-containing protein n=1 Tax=Spiroplasma endosymbiont of Aspidapion aeneum TaxID=3066276 RepID=UPI00313DD668